MDDIEARREARRIALLEKRNARRDDAQHRSTNRRSRIYSRDKSVNSEKGEFIAFTPKEVVDHNTRGEDSQGIGPTSQTLEENSAQPLNDHDEIQNWESRDDSFQEEKEIGEDMPLDYVEDDMPNQKVNEDLSSKMENVDGPTKQQNDRQAESNTIQQNGGQAELSPIQRNDGQAELSPIQRNDGQAELSPIQQNGGQAEKRRGIKCLTSEKRQLLKKIIMQRAHQLAREEAKRKEEEKRKYIEDTLSKFRGDFSAMSEASLESRLREMEAIAEALGEEKLCNEIRSQKLDREVNDMTCKLSSSGGKL